MVDDADACKKAAVLCKEILGFDNLSLDAKGRLTEHFIRISFTPDDFLPYTSFMMVEDKLAVEKMIMDAIVLGVRSTQASHETFNTALKTARPSFYKLDENASQNNLYWKLRNWYNISMTYRFMDDVIVSVLLKTEPDANIKFNTNKLTVSMDLARSLITPDIVARALERI